MADVQELSASDWRDRCREMIKDSPLTPGRGSVMVARQPRQSTSGGGIIIPTVAKEQAQVAMVIALGPPKRNLMGSNDEFWVKPGDTVLVNQYAGKPVVLRGIECAIFDEDDIMGRVNNID